MDYHLRRGFALLGARVEWWLPGALVVAALAGWEFQVRTGALPALFFPPPSLIGQTLVHLVGSGELIPHLSATLLRVLLGLVLGGVPGLIVGMAMGWSHRLRAIVDPFVAAAHPIPKIAILPLIMIIFGIGESSKVVVVAISTFFPVLINTMAGVREISPIYYEVAANYGAGLTKVFTRVVVPGSLPFVLSGVRIAINTALLLTIAIELIAAQEGLGAMIWFAWETLRTEELYASLAVTVVLGIGFNLLLQWMTARLVQWQIERDV